MDSNLDSFGNTIDDIETNIPLYRQSAPFLQTIENEDYRANHPNSNASINVLPLEIMIHIFSFLDPMTLNDIWKVCSRWKTLVQTREIWYKSFRNEFETLDSFPTVSNSELWVLEYIDRLVSKRNWYKANLRCQYFKIFPDDYPLISQFKADFDSNKLYGNYHGVTTLNGEFVSCNLTSGKNLSFVPSQNGSKMRSVFNRQYLLQVDDWNDSHVIKVKNLQAAKSSGSNIRSSVSCDAEFDVSCMAINDVSHTTNFEFVSGDVKGNVKFWNLKGRIIKNISLSEYPLVYIKSDYRKKVFAIDSMMNAYYVNEDKKVVVRLEMKFQNNDNVLLNNFTTISGNRWQSEVDFGTENAIFCTDTQISVINLINGEHRKLLKISNDVRIVSGSLQSVSLQKLNSYDHLLVGSDGIMYCNLLSDNSIIIWNIRDFKDNKVITPQCRIGLSGTLGPVTCISLNCLVVVVGYMNGFCEVYDLYSGNYIRHTKKPPKSLKICEDFMTSQILLNPDPMIPSGLIVTDKYVQYFQFGEISTNSIKNSRIKPKRLLNVQKLNDRKIKIELDEYDRQEEEKHQFHQMVSKYNGDVSAIDDDNFDVSLAIAVSESESQVLMEQNDLKLALELSLRPEADTETDVNDSDIFSQQLEEALKLSLEQS